MATRPPPSPSASLRTEHKSPLPTMKPYAGQTTSHPQQYHSTDAAIGFSGHLPGLHYAIGASFPTMTKLSRSYTEQLKASPPLRSPSERSVDKWGNFAPPQANTQHLKQLYLTALHPAANSSSELASHGSSAKGAMPSAPSVLSPRRALAEAPKHVTGFTGYRPGASHYYGTSFSRVESRLSPPRQGMDYEAFNQSQ